MFFQSRIRKKHIYTYQLSTLGNRTSIEAVRLGFHIFFPSVLLLRFLFHKQIQPTAMDEWETYVDEANNKKYPKILYKLEKSIKIYSGRISWNHLKTSHERNKKISDVSKGNRGLE